MYSLLVGSPSYASPLALILGSLCIGILLSPFGSGVFFLALFLIIWEVLFYGYCLYNQYDWCAPVRITALLAYVLGWIIGRSVTNNHPMEPGLPDYLEQWFRPRES